MSDPTPPQHRGQHVEPEPVVPVDIKLERARQKLTLQWSDGHRSELDAATLRQNCPCAGCRAERQKRARTPLPVLDVAADQATTLTGAELMGQYGVKLIWADGHDAGIFDYRYLRSLDPT